MTKIIDIVTDQKFIDDMIERHDVLDAFSKHEYVMVGFLDGYQYIKQVDRIKQIKKEDFLDYIKNSGCDGVFLHNLYSLPLDLIPLIPEKIKVFWALWGFDIYGRPKGNPLVKVDLHHKQTLAFLENQKTFYTKCKDIIKKIIGKYRSDFSIYRKAVERIDYISGVLPFEFSFIKQVLPKIKAQPFSYSYSTMVGLQSTPDFEPNCGNSILIGNSGDITNNHLDVIECLSNFDLGNRSIFCPLSYSGSSLYVNEVIERGSSAFGDNFKPLKAYIPLLEYKKILKECGYCIFFHERQQALGNINNALKMGSKVFLSETNPVFYYYKKLGIHIFSIQKDLNPESLSTSLSAQQVKENVTILTSQKNIDTETDKLKVISFLCK